MPPSKVRHKSEVALILVDVINHFEFPDGAQLLRNALPIAPRLARLKKRANEVGVPVVYVNDNFGQWRSDASKLVKHCLRPGAPSRSFVEAIKPSEEDYFVLKPMHSAFYQTPLETLLRYLGTTSLVLCGLATNSCIICTAHDANMRDLKLSVASDCCAARSRREHEEALSQIKGIADAKVLKSTAIRFPHAKKTRG